MDAMTRTLALLLLLAGCAPRVQPADTTTPLTLTFDWPAAMTLKGHRSKSITTRDARGVPQEKRAEATFRTTVEATDGGYRVDVRDVMPTEDPDSESALAMKLAAVTTRLDAEGTPTKVEGAVDLAYATLMTSGGPERQVRELAPQLALQVENTTLAEWTELIGLWRGLTLRGTAPLDVDVARMVPASAPQTVENLLQRLEVRSLGPAPCTPGETPARCVKLHALATPDPRGDLTSQLTQTLRLRAEDPELVVTALELSVALDIVTDPRTLVPTSYVNTRTMNVSTRSHGANIDLSEVQRTTITWSREQ